jgi:hypothetical protein
LLQIYELPTLPPFATKVAAPEVKHQVSGPLMLITGFTQIGQDAINVLVVAVQPLASVTVTLKFPALQMLLIDDVVAPVFHK